VIAFTPPPGLPSAQRDAARQPRRDPRRAPPLPGCARWPRGPRRGRRPARPRGPPAHAEDVYLEPSHDGAVRESLSELVGLEPERSIRCATTCSSSGATRRRASSPS
jgi:hypothetical protein